MTELAVYRGGGVFEKVALADLLGRLRDRRLTTAPPFSPERIAVITELSDSLRANPQLRDRPSLAYFAHWTRGTALRALATRFETTAVPGTLSAPRGIVLHLPPRNVETMLLFSWVVSYLAGNANVVRLPTEQSGAVMEAVELVAKHLSAVEGCAEVFVCYPAEDALNRALSRACDARVVWGGDAKIQAFEGLPLRSGGKAIWFGDRYSYCAISGPALACADSDELTALAYKLVADIFTFDQMACSSPHKIYVVGDATTYRPAVTALLAAVDAAARRRGADIPTSHTIRKMTEALTLASAGAEAFVPQLSGELISVVFSQLRQVEDRIGGGFIVVEFIPDLRTLADMVQPGHQTLTHYGFTTAEMTTFAKSSIQAGLSRIVPVGRALDFDVIWDGYDLTRELTRTIRIA
jgi:hypothetical protein